MKHTTTLLVGWCYYAVLCYAVILRNIHKKEWNVFNFNENVTKYLIVNAGLIGLLTIGHCITRKLPFLIQDQINYTRRFLVSSQEDVVEIDEMIKTRENKVKIFLDHIVIIL